MSCTKKNLAEMSELHSNDKFEPFIKEINFVSFKNIEPKNHISFDFPITVLVGKNGTNKSSALLALYGCAPRKSISEYWFTTSLDTQTEERPRYFYSYIDKESQKTAQVLQLWIKKSTENVLDYWESARPATTDGMLDLPEQTTSENLRDTRWSKIKKDVTYINFKSNLSAFDKFFYHSENPSDSENLKRKQDYIRYHSKKLQKAIKESSKSHKDHNKEKIIKKINSQLNPSEIDDISTILDKKYEKIHYIEHSFFYVDGGTAILETGNLQYSEAYAGSGEYSIVSLVYKLHRCKSNSLVLLDEPEVSLHPGAQKKLLDFIIKIAIKKKLQFVISSHSPVFIENLPASAIKLFSYDPEKEKVNIFNNVKPEFAFKELGSDKQKTNIYVEDILLQEIIETAIRSDNNLKSKFSVMSLGGSNNIITYHTYILAKTDHKSIIILDGDQKKQHYIDENEKFPNPSFVNDENIMNVINNFYGEVKLLPSGNKKSGINQSELIEMQKTVLEYIFKSVNYLHLDTPEDLLINYKDFDKIISSMIANSDKIKNHDNKTYFRDLTSAFYNKSKEETTSKDIFSFQKNLVAMINNADNNYLNPIRRILEKNE